MVSSKATTVPQYLASLPAERRAEIERVRDVVNQNLPAGYQEGMLYGMIGWYVPLSKFADTYNGQPIGIAGLAAQKDKSSLYLMAPYGDPGTNEWFRAAWKKTGKKLDMGKSCIRFKKADDLALDVIAETIRRVGVDALISHHQAAHSKTRTGAKKKPAKKKTQRRAR